MFGEYESEVAEQDRGRCQQDQKEKQGFVGWTEIDLAIRVAG